MAFGTRQFPGESIHRCSRSSTSRGAPVVVGYLLLVLLAAMAIGHRRMALRPNGISVAFNWKGAAIAAAVMAFPLMVRAMRLSLEAVDCRFRGGCAHPRRIAHPRLSHYYIAVNGPRHHRRRRAFVLCPRLGEFGATITFVSNIPGETQTLSLALYTLAQTPDGELGAMRLAFISIAIALR